MDESEADHLSELWKANIRPNCGNMIPENARVGSGKKSEGGFCSVACYGDY